MKRYLLIPQVMQELSLSRNTIYKFIAEGKLKTIIEEQGSRTVFKFEPEEIARFKTLLRGKRQRGKPIT